MVSAYSSTKPTYIGDDVYIKPTYIIAKAAFDTKFRSRSRKQIDNQKNLKDNKRRSDLSKKAMSNLRNAINWLVVSSKYKKVYSKAEQKHFYFKVNFITLTIPPQKNEVITEKEFKHCMATFLTYARKYFYLTNYIWKIEAHADKRLHVHFTTDTFINHKALRECWNRILQSKDLLNEHFAKFNNYNPNSTDVHGVYKVHDLAAYMCEYMVKKPELPEGYKGRIWSCSYSLSATNKCNTFIESNCDKNDLSFANSGKLKHKPIESKPDGLGETKKLADMWFINLNDWDKYVQGVVKSAFDNHIREIREKTKSCPTEYLTIDMFASNFSKKVSKLQPVKTDIKECEISTDIAKIGTTSFVQLSLNEMLISAESAVSNTNLIF